MSKEKVVILGAGLAGLSTAYHLEKRGIDYKVFEKENEVGGLCRSKKIKGFTFDHDGHLLHFRHKDIFKLAKLLLKNNLVLHKRNAWIYSFDRFTPYPFQANLYGLPASVILDCLLGFVEVNNGRPKRVDPSFLSWIKQTFGEGIARHFMIPYNRKFWHKPLDSLNCKWVSDYIPVPTLKELIEGTLGQSRRRFGYNAYFWYPAKGGIQELVSAFSRKIKEIFTSYEATKINIANKKISFKNKEEENFDILVSSLPLVEIMKITEDVPQDVAQAVKRLKWVSIFNLNLGIDRPNVSGRHWIYFPEDKYIFFRVGFPHNFSKFQAPRGKSSLYAEVSYPASKKLDSDKTAAGIIEDLIEMGMISKKDKIIAKDTNDIKYGYIIYDRSHLCATYKILKFLSSRNIFSIGRFGSWRYMTMEDAILEGRATARKIINNHARYL